MFDQLPWETPPQAIKDAHAEIKWKEGVLRIPRFGYLTVDEMTDIAKVDPSNSPYLVTMTKSNELAVASELSPRYCYSILTRHYVKNLGARADFTDEEDDISIKHSLIIRSYLDQMNTRQNLINIRAATIMVQRVAPHWQEEKTRKLPKELIALLCEVYQEEERGMDKPTTPEEDMKLLDEQLGKLRQVGLIAADQTGSGATGSVSGSGQEPPSSAANASDASQVPTSSKRSKRVTKPSGSGFTTKNSPPLSSPGTRRKSTATAT
jgi:hypothetical protein